MSERELGKIVRLQVQRDPLKARGVGYDPTPILVVEEASLSAAGLVGRHRGGWVLDAHNAAHPRSQGGGRRALSIGFVGHYLAMAQRFGSADIGVAGENIIVDAAGLITKSDLVGEVVIHATSGEAVLGSARVAAPCAEFTSFLKRLDHVMPLQDQRADADFLDDGMRGYILAVDRVERPVTIRVGDRVTVRS